MKKWIKIAGVLVVAVMGVVMLAGVALAQGPTDADQDGVCDVCGAEAHRGWTIGDRLMRGWRLNQGSEQADGRGMMRGWRLAQNGDGTRPGWVDENGDGICDNCVNGTCPNAQEGARGPMGRWQSQ